MIRNVWRCMPAYVLILLIPLLTMTAQPKKGLYGISTSISRGFVQSHSISTAAGSLNIGMAYLPSDRISLRGEIGFLSQKDTSNAAYSEFAFTGSLWYYLQTSESISTFLGSSVGFGSATDASAKGTSLLSLQGFFGAEYWMSKRFSWYGHIGLMYNAYTVAEKKASDIFTSASTGLTWYF